MKIFISYRRCNGGSSYAYLINSLLEKIGIETFFDKKNMIEHSGDFFADIISPALKQSTVLLLILQKGMFSAKRQEDYVQKEILHFLESGKTIIPVPLEDFSWTDEEKNNLAENIASISMLDLLTPNFTIDNMELFQTRLLKKLYIDTNHPNAILSEWAQKIAPSHFMITVSDFQQINPARRWTNAKKVSLLAIACGSVIERFYDELKLCYSKGTSFNFMSVDAKTLHRKEIENDRQCNRFRGQSKGYLKAQIATNKMLLAKIQNECNSPIDAKIEYRLTCCNITSTIQIIEHADSALDYIIVEYLPNKGYSQGHEQNQMNMPVAIIRRNDRLFDFYYDQFNIIWNEARKV